MTRVLVVDDCPNMRKMLCEILVMEGFATLTARDGQEALEILWKSAEPLIALLDCMMPRMTGVDTLRYLAEDPERAQRHTIVLMSAYPDYPRAAAQVFPYGPLPFLAKPFPVEQFLDAVFHGRDRLRRGGPTDRKPPMWLRPV